MIARFFIDRPIFATVLSVVITLIGGIALLVLPIAQYPRITPPGVVIAISYPGASAQVVADTVAAPIEQQVSGVPGMLYMSSQSGNDGSYSLTVTFDVGTDLNTDLVMVQNRVTLAMPQLPTAVQNQGITIRKKTPDILMIVNFFSPDGRYDDIYLSNFATIYVRDELLRVYGVSDINYLGQRDYSIRAWLDPQKLASRNMTAMDVASAIRDQNLDAPAGQIGQPPAARGQSSQLPIDTLGRLTEPEQFGDIIVKVDPATAPDLSARSAMSTQGSLGRGWGWRLEPEHLVCHGPKLLAVRRPDADRHDSSSIRSRRPSRAAGSCKPVQRASLAPTIGPTARIGATGGRPDHQHRDQHGRGNQCRSGVHRIDWRWERPWSRNQRGRRHHRRWSDNSHRRFGVRRRSCDQQSADWQCPDPRHHELGGRPRPSQPQRLGGSPA